MSIKVEVESLDNYGKGIAHVDGKIVFIENALPSEIVLIDIVKDSKRFAEAKVAQYLEKSDKRVITKCPYYGKCGGCDISHLSYREQIDFKTDKVKSILKRNADLEICPEVICQTNEYNYRNKVSLKIVDGKWGYFEDKTHNLVEIDYCLLANDSLNQIIKQKNLFNIKNGEVIIRCNYLEEVLIVVKSLDELNINVDDLPANQKIVGVIFNDEVIYGQDFLLEKVNDKIFKVNYKSFFQVNLNILGEVFKILEKKKYKTIIDLYCGVGTLGIAINKKKLYGIEINKDAIQDAEYNAKMNQEKDNNYMVGDSSKIKEIDEKYDAVIIDPPRSGLSKQTLEHILKSDVKELIYMSCDINSLARDLNSLKEKYSLKKVYVLDMFPQTYHVETLCLLTLYNR